MFRKEEVWWLDVLVYSHISYIGRVRMQISSIPISTEKRMHKFSVVEQDKDTEYLLCANQIDNVSSRHLKSNVQMSELHHLMRLWRLSTYMDLTLCMIQPDDITFQFSIRIPDMITAHSFKTVCNANGFNGKYIETTKLKNEFIVNHSSHSLVCTLNHHGTLPRDEGNQHKWYVSTTKYF